MVLLRQKYSIVCLVVLVLAKIMPRFTSLRNGGCYQEDEQAFGS